MDSPSLSLSPQARDDKLDFVEACGRPTLALKKCTDDHPEYYGALDERPSGEGEGDDDDTDGTPPPPPPGK